MSSVTSITSILFLSSKTPSHLRRSDVTIFNTPSPFLCFLRSAVPRLRLSVSLAGRNVGFSWFSPSPNATEEYGGWAVVDCPVRETQKKGMHKVLILGITTSVAVLAAAIAYLSLSKKGIKIQFIKPLQVLEKTDSASNAQGNGSITMVFETSNEDNLVSKASKESIPDTFAQTVASDEPGRVTIPITVDSTQMEAFSVLKKLKIIEDDVRADELCIRRQYARWLIRLYSQFERGLKHRVIPTMALSGSMITAFDDLNAEDPDFKTVQALAEAGVVPSKLSRKCTSGSDDLGGEDINFLPERYISRQDLIDWKAQFEYAHLPQSIEQISNKQVDLLDVKEITSDASPALFMDILAGDKSIIRKVFGQSKRLQPKKPSTVAQAAVALASGSMSEAISSELSRIEDENSARLTEMESVRIELLERGHLQRFWADKLNEEKLRGSAVEQLYFDALQNLEHEKIVHCKMVMEHMKEKAATDCQKQLLHNLKEEVDDMTVKLASESATYISEKHSVVEMLRDLETKLETLLDLKSTLQAEKEALQMLRSWVEDEAKKSQARAKVLEEVGRRWKWDSQG